MWYDRLSPSGNRGFPKVKETNIHTHAYITSNTKKPKIYWRYYYGSKLNLHPNAVISIFLTSDWHTQDTKPLGKYARMRRTFLEQNKPMLFNDMALTETLFPHLWEVQKTCEKRMELLMGELLAKNPAPDKAYTAACMGSAHE